MGIARQIAARLREAHKHGVVHRDLKPSNVMLVPGEDTGELVKILDFGLVKVLADDSEELTQQGSFLGSPRFMSPEQISHGKVDLRTDVYSLGVILYQMLSGKVPFEAQNSVQILIAHLQQPVPRMKERNPEADVPEPLEAFVLRCLSKDPDGRPANMEALIRGLGECAQAMGLSPAFGSTGLVTMDSTGTGRMPTPMPPVRVMTAIPASSSSPSSTSGATTSQVDDASLGAASRLADAAPQGRKGIVLVAVGVLAVAGIGVAMSQMRSSEPPPAPAAAQPAKPQVAPPPADVGSFVLMVESMPSGAEVLEDGKPLGNTPLQLSLSNSSVRANPRRLTVRHEGYEPYSIVQGPSDQSVRLVATLTKQARGADEHACRAHAAPGLPGASPLRWPAGREAHARSRRSAPAPFSSAAGYPDRTMTLQRPTHHIVASPSVFTARPLWADVLGGVEAPCSRISIDGHPPRGVHGEGDDVPRSPEYAQECAHGHAHARQPAQREERQIQRRTGPSQTARTTARTIDRRSRYSSVPAGSRLQALRPADALPRPIPSGIRC